MLTLSIAVVRIWSILQGFLTIPGHTRLVLPLLSINLSRLLIINLLIFPIISLLKFLIINLPMYLIINLSMPVTPKLPILVTTSQCTQHSLVTTILLVTTRVLVIMLILINHQVPSFPSLLFNNHQNRRNYLWCTHLYFIDLE
eukprot:TRINITY_DN5969_c0_g1_i1.p2 TRINITY_DN5969_c0_g1~~TRINITY_DN5969_c0_g1_i1.p2  ORF type:complete len:143 (-),score=27.12 TRINITY_DN5969_c0_g1_i1:27-455(-)